MQKIEWKSKFIFIICSIVYGKESFILMIN